MGVPARLRRVNLLGLSTSAVLVGTWEAVVRWRLAQYELLPAPSGVAAAWADLLGSGELLAVTAHTLRSTIVGWALAVLVGLALGVWLGLSDRAWRYSMASIEVVRAIPPVALVPVALLVFGFSLRMELTLIVYVGAWTVLVNTIDGVRGVRPELLDVARMLRMPTRTRIRKVILPAAAPTVVVGLRLALSLALVLAVVAEMIGNPRGLGNALVSAQHALQPERMFAYVATVGLLGIGLNATLRTVAGRALPTTAAGDNEWA